MDDAAFLRAIINEPEDDLPRLAYADFLDESGDAERAEFICVQCELARLPEHDPEYAALEDREHELLGANETKWFPNRDGLREWDWKRGFVEQIDDHNADSCSLAQLFEHQPITKYCRTFRLTDTYDGPLEESPFRHDVLHRLEGVDFSNSDFLPTDLYPQLLQSRLPNLTEFGLECVREADSVLLAAFEQRPGATLRKLNLNHAFDQWIDADVLFPAERLLAFLADHPVNELRIAQRSLSWNHLRQLLQSDAGMALNSLDISHNQLGADAYAAFIEGNPKLRLQSLDVSGTPLGAISLGPLLAARALENLEKLEINGCGSARDNLELLPDSAFWNRATHLRVHNCSIQSRLLEPLVRSSGPPTLRLLDLADNFLRIEGVRALVLAPWVDSLTWLALSGNLLDDGACTAIAASDRFHNLRTLHLANNGGRIQMNEYDHISDAGVRTLAGDPSLAKLRVLTLSATGITNSGAAAALESQHWKLSGLGIANCDLGPGLGRILAAAPNTHRLNWLDVAGNRRLGGMELLPFAESPNLSPLLELDCAGIDLAPRVQQAFRRRLGVRFSS